MSHIFLFGGVKIGSHSIPLLCFAEKIDLCGL